MMNVPLIKTFVYDAPIGKVWAALTDTAQMKVWYFPQLRKFEPVVGYAFEFDDPESAYQKEWVVTQIEAGKRFAHSWSYQGYPGSSEVIFDLSSEEEKTKLTVTQTGLESFPDDPHFARSRFEWGWDTLLGENLKRLVESK
ncbi:MAG TPA: SRPBCC domain-containing protein [Mucilaginibacter sp.]|nr:SRPBCC domain-containing protein [Mucilaginibacter sp.]